MGTAATTRSGRRTPRMAIAQTLGATALIAYYLFYGVRGALGDDAVVPAAMKPANLMYVHGLGYHMIMDACFMIGVVVNDIAHEMMPAFVAAMLIVVYSHQLGQEYDLLGAAPAGAFALVFAYLARGAPARKPMVWNLATVFFSLQGLLILLVGVAMLLGDDTVIPEQMKPLASLSQLKLIGTTELTLSAYVFGSIVAGHAQAMQPFCALFMVVALALHVVIGDIEGCPLIVVLAIAHLCLGLFWKAKGDAKKE